ncbi:hypothetical protein KUCAC02_001122 [Chaenocephalus aceratus]|uniref:Uncharacterized protein n=1 Tax=Chaenocephalus aceratus TaxID=36190 RepID=A0ACB9XVF1_CHAAC|nr:hypothetical protein KUCAC02_001122 [Chaenocephalus aceratus]
MFKRKLTALDYHNPGGFDCTDETHSDWPKAFHQYLQDLNCPFGGEQQPEAVDWLLGLAVRYEYGDNVDKYKNCKPLAAPTNSDKAVDPSSTLTVIRQISKQE